MKILFEYLMKTYKDSDTYKEGKQSNTLRNTRYGFEISLKELWKKSSTKRLRNIIDLKYKKSKLRFKRSLLF